MAHLLLVFSVSAMVNLGYQTKVSVSCCVYCYCSAYSSLVLRIGMFVKILWQEFHFSDANCVLLFQSKIYQR